MHVAQSCILSEAKDLAANASTRGPLWGVCTKTLPSHVALLAGATDVGG
jgi:hypothetical protein